MYSHFRVHIDIKISEKGKAKRKQFESGDYLIFDKLPLCAWTKEIANWYNNKNVKLFEIFFHYLLAWKLAKWEQSITLFVRIKVVGVVGFLWEWHILHLRFNTPLITVKRRIPETTTKNSAKLLITRNGPTLAELVNLLLPSCISHNYNIYVPTVQFENQNTFIMSDLNNERHKIFYENEKYFRNFICYTHKLASVVSTENATIVAKTTLLNQTVNVQSDKLTS